MFRNVSQRSHYVLNFPIRVKMMEEKHYAGVSIAQMHLQNDSGFFLLLLLSSFFLSFCGSFCVAIYS